MKIAIYIVLAILVLGVILVITGRKSVHHEIEIDAPKDLVWQVLTDMDKYAEWNPTMLLLEGEIKEGNKVKYRFTQDKDNISEMGATVAEVKSNELLNQKGGLPLVITFDHKYMLSGEGDKSKLTIHEDYSGIYVNFWNPAPVEEAYARLNRALKMRAELLAK